MNKQFKWPLQTDPFSFLDKLKVSKLILSGARLTQGDLVKEYEDTWENRIHSRSVMVSSGSTANILIFMWIKKCLEEAGEWPEKRQVIVPVVTWATSINQLIMLGFEPVFIDILWTNLGLDANLTEKYLEKNHQKVAAIFPTSLIGMTFDFKLIELAKHYGIKLAQDNCEASFNFIENRYVVEDRVGPKKIESHRRYVSSLTTSSTSTYIGHYTSSIEGGIIHCQNEKEYRFYLMARNHGMVRALIPYSGSLKSSCGLDHPDDDCWDWLYNRDVDPSFDFNVIGNNFRSTDLNAKFGLLDSKRWDKYIKHRQEIGKIWKENLNGRFPNEFNEWGNVPFALPITVGTAANIPHVKELLSELRIEYRSLVAGSLHRQTAYKPFIKDNNYPVGNFIHENCMYIGIPNDLDGDLVADIAHRLNPFIK